MIQIFEIDDDHYSSPIQTQRAGLVLIQKNCVPGDIVALEAMVTAPADLRL